MGGISSKRKRAKFHQIDAVTADELLARSLERASLEAGRAQHHSYPSRGVILEGHYPLGRSNSMPIGAQVYVRAPQQNPVQRSRGNRTAYEEQNYLADQVRIMSALGVSREVQVHLLSEGNMTPETFEELSILFDLAEEERQQRVPQVRPRIRTVQSLQPHASTEEINSIPTVMWNESLSESLGDTCNICLETYCANDKLMRLPICLHAFHYQCSRTWLTQKPQCPVCRSKVVP